MKRILLLISLLGILIIGCQQQETAEPLTILPSKSETYTNAEYGFSLNYPLGWEVTEESEAHDTTIRFSTDTAAVSILVWKPSGDPLYAFYSLDDFYDRGVIAGWEDHEGFELLEERNIEIDELPAKEVTFIWKIPDPDVVYKDTIVAFLDTRYGVAFPDSNAIKITYVMPIDIPDDIKAHFEALYDSPIMYDDYYHDFRLIVDTFEFNERLGRN